MFQEILVQMKSCTASSRLRKNSASKNTIQILSVVKKVKAAFFMLSITTQSEIHQCETNVVALIFASKWQKVANLWEKNGKLRGKNCGLELRVSGNAVKKLRITSKR